jgi:hypothetical protein
VKFFALLYPRGSRPSDRYNNNRGGISDKNLDIEEQEKNKRRNQKRNPECFSLGHFIIHFGIGLSLSFNHRFVDFILRSEY